MRKNIIKMLWYILVFLQLFILNLVLFEYYSDDVKLSGFVLCMGISTCISCILTYSYFNYKRGKTISKKEIILVSLLIGFIFWLLILSYILIILLLVWFLFVIFFIGTKYVFKKELVNLV